MDGPYQIVAELRPWNCGNIPVYMVYLRAFHRNYLTTVSAAYVNRWHHCVLLMILLGLLIRSLKFPTLEKK